MLIMFIKHFLLDLAVLSWESDCRNWLQSRMPSFLYYPKTSNDSRVICGATLWSMWPLSEAGKSSNAYELERALPWLWLSTAIFTWFQLKGFHGGSHRASLFLKAVSGLWPQARSLQIGLKGYRASRYAPHPHPNSSNRASFSLGWPHTCYEAGNDLELLTILPPPPKSQDSRLAPTTPSSTSFWWME